MKRLIATVALAGAVTLAGAAALPAHASAKKHRRAPHLSMSYVKHDAWETMHDYADTRSVDWKGVDDMRYRCHRVSRSVADCKTSMLFWKHADGCVEPGDPAYPDYSADLDDEECPVGSRWGGWWEGERHAWKMRYRAGQALYTIHLDKYVLGDRWADTDPTDEKFGGRALRVTEEEGV